MSLVMVVEDEQVLRESMVRSLRRLPGVEVVEASRYSDARRLMVEERPALLVSDLSLPDASALGLLAELDAAALDIPVIFITAYFGRFRDQIPRRQGVEVFEKPLPMNTLREVVLQQIEASRHRLRPPFSLPEYLQMAGLGRHSVMIRATREGLSQGWIRMVKGELWSARCGALRGEPAVCGLTFMQDARIDVEHLEGEPGPREVHAPVEAVLLEAFRILDEAHRDQRTGLDGVLAVLDASDEDAFSFSTLPPPPLGIEHEDRTPETPAVASGLRRGEREPSSGLRRGEREASSGLRSAEPRSNRRKRMTAGELLDFAQLPSPLQPPARPELTFDDLLDEGREAVFMRDYARAWMAFEAAARLNPHHPGVRTNLERLAQMRRRA